MKKLAVVLLFLVACQFVPQQPVQQITEFNTGTSAVELAFAGLPEVLMCQQADIIVNMRNVGSSNAEGVYSFIFEGQKLKPLSPVKGMFSLEGRSIINPVGGYDQALLRVSSTDLDKNQQVYQTPLVFQASYKYKTSASIPICIDPDVRNINKNKVCANQPISLTGGQGAPIAVTLVESVMAPEGDLVRPVFKIHYQNLGHGQVVNDDRADRDCKQGLLDLHPVVEIQGMKLSCLPLCAEISPGKDSELVCKSDLAYGLAQGTFSSVLSVGFDYSYVNSVTVPVTIKRLYDGQTCKSEK